MAKLRAGKALAKVLKNEGVKYVFTVAVSNYLPFYGGCIDEGIEIINVRHEQAAAYAADAWGRITRTPGVCLGIGGCGTTNMTTALVGAYYECSPLVALSPVGESGEPLSREGESRQFNASRMFEPYVKWCARCTDPSLLARYGQWAFRHATTGRMGPTILEMPTETFYEYCDWVDVKPEAYRATNRLHIDEQLAKRAVAMLLEAKRPLIIIGNGVHWSNAYPELRDFARLMNLPLVSKAGLAQGYFPEDDPLFAGVTISFNRPNCPAQITPKADVILVIGARAEKLTAFPNLSAEARIIQIDLEPSEIGRIGNVELGITGDAKTVLSQLIKASKELASIPSESNWLRFVEEEKQKYEDGIRELGYCKSKPIHPARLVREIRDFLDKGAYVIIDGADIGSMGRTYLRAHFPGHFMIAHGNWGNMGPGVAFALATKLARGDSQVLLLTSDGSFGFNAMELETASRYGIKFVCVVSNNLGWGAEIGPALRTAGQVYTSKMSVTLPEATRYDKLAEALGCYGELIADPEEIKPALMRAFDSELPALLDIRMSTEDWWPIRSKMAIPMEEYLTKTST